VLKNFASLFGKSLIVLRDESENLKHMLKIFKVPVGVTE